MQKMQISAQINTQSAPPNLLYFTNTLRHKKRMTVKADYIQLCHCIPQSPAH